MGLLARAALSVKAEPTVWEVRMVSVELTDLHLTRQCKWAACVT